MKQAMIVGMAVLTAGSMGALAAPAETKDMRAFYQYHCAGCHGVDGAARNPAGKSLRGQDFTDARWQKGTGDAAMVKTIRKGLFFGWAMPAFKDQLTDEEAQRLVTEVIRQAVKGKPIEPSPVALGNK